MEFCPFHKKECEENEMITIIELKKGKIKQTTICQNCAKGYLGIVDLIDSVPEKIEEILDLFIENNSNNECIECLELNSNDKNLSSEQKIKILENKMAAAVKVEDYETAATIKKQIELIKSSN